MSRRDPNCTGEGSSVLQANANEVRGLSRQFKRQGGNDRLGVQIREEGLESASQTKCRRHLDAVAIDAARRPPEGAKGERPEPAREPQHGVRKLSYVYRMEADSQPT